MALLGVDIVSGSKIANDAEDLAKRAEDRGGPREDGRESLLFSDMAGKDCCSLREMGVLEELLPLVMALDNEQSFRAILASLAIVTDVIAHPDDAIRSGARKVSTLLLKKV